MPSTRKIAAQAGVTAGDRCRAEGLQGAAGGGQRLQRAGGRRHAARHRRADRLPRSAWEKLMKVLVTGQYIFKIDAYRLSVQLQITFEISPCG